MSALAYYYFRQCSSKPLRHNWPIYGLLFFGIINFIWFSPQRHIFFYTFTIILYIIYFLIAKIIFKMRWQESILHTMLYYFLTHFVVRSINWIFFQNLGYSPLERGSKFLMALANNLMIVLIATGILLLFRRKLRLLADYELSTREFINILLLGVPLVWFCHSEYLITIDYLHFPPQIVLMRGVISLGAVYALVGIITANKSQAEQLEVQKIQSLLENQYKQFKLKQETSELVMAKCHDLQKHLHLFETTRQPAHIESYRQELIQTIRDFDSIYQTGNATIDALLSDASLKCQGDSVQLICLLNGRSFNFINPMDLCTIFGNALDNAIESVRSIANVEKRIVHIKAFEQKGFLLLRFDNYFEHDLLWEDGVLQTSKPDKNSHGFGLKSIGHAVDKYQGQVTSQTMEGRFLLTVTFPLD